PHQGRSARPDGPALQGRRADAGRQVSRGPGRALLMAMHVFAYGTLMCHDILSVAAGAIPPPSEPAVLSGFSRHPVAGEDYPGIRRCVDARVSGLLYREFDVAAIARLDIFEGPQYQRESVTVTLADGRRELAQ